MYLIFVIKLLILPMFYINLGGSSCFAPKVNHIIIEVDLNFIENLARGAVVKWLSPPFNQKFGCSRPTMIGARCLRVRQQYPAQKNNQKNCMQFLGRGTTAVHCDELHSLHDGPFLRG